MTASAFCLRIATVSIISHTDMSTSLSFSCTGSPLTPHPTHPHTSLNPRPFPLFRKPRIASSLWRGRKQHFGYSLVSHGNGHELSMAVHRMIELRMRFRTSCKHSLIVSASRSYFIGVCLLTLFTKASAPSKLERR